jgi:hypothetical protein
LSSRTRIALLQERQEYAREILGRERQEDLRVG